MDNKRLFYEIKKHAPVFTYPEIIKIGYQKNTGKKCDLRNPRSFSEKIQWSKLYRRDELITRLSDKLEARDWAGNKIGNEFIVPLIGDVYSSAEEIDVTNMPDSFVIKANHGSGFNVIVRDKNRIDWDKTKILLNGYLKKNFAFYAMELQYKDITPKLYCEKFLIEPHSEDLPDYKFFCFNGKVFCSYTMVDYQFDHSNGKLGFFDRDYNLMPYYRKDFERIERQINKPKNYEKMVEIAEILSKDFSHVRVDLYNIDGDIYFGEMTFSTNAGYLLFEPDEFDVVLGDEWDLNSGI